MKPYSILCKYVFKQKILFVIVDVLSRKHFQNCLFTTSFSLGTILIRHTFDKKGLNIILGKFHFATLQPFITVNRILFKFETFWLDRELTNLQNNLMLQWISHYIPITHSPWNILLNLHFRTMLMFFYFNDNHE